MTYYRCKCGNREAWGSMPPAPCTRCNVCGSDLAMSPQMHFEPKPHDYVTRYDEATGKPVEVCRMCWRRKEELEETDKPEALKES